MSLDFGVYTIINNILICMLYMTEKVCFLKVIRD